MAASQGVPACEVPDGCLSVPRHGDAQKAAQAGPLALSLKEPSAHLAPSGALVGRAAVLGVATRALFREAVHDFRQWASVDAPVRQAASLVQQVLPQRDALRRAGRQLLHPDWAVAQPQVSALGPVSLSSDVLQAR